MNNNFKHRVNWVDGMKINKNHFIEMEDAMFYMVQKSNKKELTPLNYGLLPDYSGQANSLDLSISVDGQNTVEVILNSCKAVTLGGVQVDITEATKKMLEESGCKLQQKIDITQEDNEFYIVLTVNPFKRLAVGDADPEEEPPRKPYVAPEYKLSVLPSKELGMNEVGLYHLTIGRLSLNESRLVLDNHYIPPSKSIQSHPDLINAYGDLVVFYNTLESYVMQIIQKIHQKNQNNDLANMVLNTSQRILDYLTISIPEMKMLSMYEPPIAMVHKLACFARVIKNSFDVYAGCGKEDLLNYLSDWSDLKQGTLENVLVEILELKYQHTNINSVLEKAATFTKVILTMFKKLNELEYIGKKSDSSIFVKEEVVEKTENKSRRSFLLD